jgi:hypothetical protein
MAKRSFDDLTVIATGAQSFHERFGKERRSIYDSPPISQWRCNLVGGTLRYVCPSDGKDVAREGHQNQPD